MNDGHASKRLPSPAEATSHRFRSVLLVVCWATVWGLGLLPVVAFPLLYAGLAFGWFDTPIRSHGIADPAADFELKTGLTWPKDAKLLSADDTHMDPNSGPAFAMGPGMFEGHFHITFEAAPIVVEGWLAGRAPWNSEWHDGPLPKEIVVKTSLAGGPPFDSPSVKYAARDRANQRFHDPFQHGEVLVLDVERGRVWLASWD